MPLVSVIIPVHQGSATISAAIDSVLDQSFKDLEIIVVDDGSSDLLDQALRKYGDKITLIKQPNLGASAARNNGIEKSTGEIIAFLDADDLWLPNKLSQQLSLFCSDPDVGVVFGNVEFSYGESIQKETSFELYHPQRGEVLFPLFRRNFVPLLSVLIRRRVLNNVGLFDPAIRFVEDYDLLLRIALDWKFDFTTDAVGIYRISDHQVSKNFTQAASYLLNMKEKFYLGHKDLFKKADKEIISGGLWNKYFRLAMWHLHDKNLAQAKSVLNRYLQLGDITAMYIAFHALVYSPAFLRNMIIRLWEKIHQKPKIGLF